MTETVNIKKRLATGAVVERAFPKNSNAVRKSEAKKRERVVWSGGTKIGSFKS